MVSGVRSIENGGGAAASNTTVAAVSGLMDGFQTLSGGPTPQVAAPAQAPSSGADQPVAASLTTSSTTPAPAAQPQSNDFLGGAADLTRRASGYQGSSSLSKTATIFDTVKGVMGILQ